MAPPNERFVFGDQLPDLLRLLHWRIPDPGPPWLRELLSQEGQVAVATAQLQFQKEVLAAESKAIDAHIAALNKGQAPQKAR